MFVTCCLMLRGYFFQVSTISFNRVFNRSTIGLTFNATSATDFTRSNCSIHFFLPVWICSRLLFNNMFPSFPIIPFVLMCKIIQGRKTVKRFIELNYGETASNRWCAFIIQSFNNLTKLNLFTQEKTRTGFVSIPFTLNVEGSQTVEADPSTSLFDVFR